MTLKKFDYMKKDILFLCQFFYPEHNSSATLPFDTAKYLASHGFSVDALCGYPKEYNFDGQVPMKETVDGVNISRIKYVQLGRKQKLSRLVNYFSFTFFALLRVFRLRNYKSVIVYSNPPVLPVVPVLANALFGTKFVFVAYDVYPEVAYASKSLSPGGMIDKVMKWLNKAIYRRVSMVVALTDEMKDFLLKNRPELTADRVTTIANWAHEAGVCTASDAKKHFGFSNEQFVVGYFGNMGVCQEMETLLGAMRELKNDPNYGFIFVGHGNKHERVESVIRDEWVENARLYGFLVGEDFEKALAAADCCVVSLEKGLMGTCAPSKYYSYLQAGKPVIVVVEENSYLWEEIKKEQLGAAVQLENIEAMVSAIMTLAEDKAELMGMSHRSARMYEDNYALEIGLGKYRKMMVRIFETK